MLLRPAVVAKLPPTETTLPAEGCPLVAAGIIASIPGITKSQGRRSMVHDPKSGPQHNGLALPHGLAVGQVVNSLPTCQN